MHYFFDVSKLWRRLSRLVIACVFALAAACGDVADLSGEARRLEQVATEEGTKSISQPAIKAYVRPPFAIEIDTHGQKAFLDLRQPDKKPKLLATAPNRPWYKPPAVRHQLALAAQNGGFWTSIRHLTEAAPADSAEGVQEAPPEVPDAAQAAPENAPQPGPAAASACFRETLKSPMLMHGERETHLRYVAELLQKNKLAMSPDGGFRLRFFAKQMPVDMLLHFVSSVHHFDQELVALFGVPAAYASNLSSEFLRALREKHPRSMDEIAALYDEHHAAQRARLDLGMLSGQGAAIELRFFSADPHPELLLLYVDTMYAMLKMAHTVAAFEDSEWAMLVYESDINIDTFIEEVGKAAPELVERLKAQHAKVTTHAKPEGQDRAKGPADVARK